MDQPLISFAAVFLKGDQGYVGFVEELPAVDSHGKAIEEARENLRLLALVVFDEERAQSAELLKGKDVVREAFNVAVARI